MKQTILFTVQRHNSHLSNDDFLSGLGALTLFYETSNYLRIGKIDCVR